MTSPSDEAEKEHLRAVLKRKLQLYPPQKFRKVVLPSFVEREIFLSNKFENALDRLKNLVNPETTGRRCEICNADISMDDGRRKECRDCRAPVRADRAGWRKKNGCMDCGADISHRKGPAKRCEACVAKIHSEDSKRWYHSHKDYFQQRSQK